MSGDRQSKTVDDDAGACWTSRPIDPRSPSVTSCRTAGTDWTSWTSIIGPETVLTGWRNVTSAFRSAKRTTWLTTVRATIETRGTTITVIFVPVIWNS